MAVKGGRADELVNRSLPGNLTYHRPVGKKMEEQYEPTLEQVVPPILNPAVNDARTKIADRAASCPRGLKSFLEVGLPFVLIGWVTHPSFELTIELLKGGQLLECVQIAVIATLESRKRLAVIKQRLRTL